MSNYPPNLNSLTIPMCKTFSGCAPLRIVTAKF